MNLKHLKYFYEIAKQGQITLAAKKLHIAQPPLSQALKTLETELGVLLFERHGRKLMITEAGKRLYEKAHILFDHIEETINEVQNIGKGVMGTLSIGVNKSCFSHIPDKISFFQGKFPEVHFKLTEGDSYLLSNQLISREIDFAIARLPMDLSNFEYILLPEEEYVAVVSHNWYGGNHDSISFDDLSKIPLLLLHRIKGTGQFELVLEQFHNRDLHPKIICESPNVDMLLGLVSEGLGATIVPKSTLLSYNTTNVSILNIQDSTLYSKSAVMWLRERYLTNGALVFLELFKTNDETNRTF